MATQSRYNTQSHNFITLDLHDLVRHGRLNGPHHTDLLWRTRYAHSTDRTSLLQVSFVFVHTQTTSSQCRGHRGYDCLFIRPDYPADVPLALRFSKQSGLGFENCSTPFRPGHGHHHGQHTQNHNRSIGTVRLKSISLP